MSNAGGVNSNAHRQEQDPVMLTVRLNATMLLLLAHALVCMLGSRQ